MEENCKLKLFKANCDKTLEKMENYLNEIKDYFNNSHKLCLNLFKKINDYKLYLNSIEYNIWHNPNILKNNDFEEFKTEYDSFNEQISKFNDLSETFDKIEEEFKKIINFVFFPEDESAIVFDFNSCSINGDNTSSVCTEKIQMQSYLDFAENYEKSNNNNSKMSFENINVCNRCKKNNIEFVDKISKNFYCKDCYNQIKHKIDGKEIDKMDKDEKDKTCFLNSIENIVKFILLKCNDILNEKEK